MTQANVKPSGILVQAPKVGGEPAATSTQGTMASAEVVTATLGVQDLRKALDDAFGGPIEERAPADEATSAQNEPEKARPGFWTFAVRRPLKIIAALALIALFGALPLQTLLQASSVEAVVNSRIVTIRAPIDGEIAAAPHDFTAWSAIKGAPVLHIIDPKADRSRLDELRRTLGRLEDERPGVVARLERAQAALGALEKQTEQFALGRARQLEARVAALQSDLAGATARAEEARAAHQRFAALIRPGVVSAAELARVNRDRLVANEAEAAARKRVEEASIELGAARTGSFLGDSYNDRPSSAQRADEVRQRIEDLSAELKTRDAQIARLAADRDEEQERYRKLSDVEVSLPVSGRVWEIMTAPGEHVRRGQDLIRILDCSTAVVTANVSETVYNRLKIGSPAKFRASDGGNDLDGVVVNLTGVSGAPANFAIQPRALLKEAYHVTVAVPKLAENRACAVGRTGRVLFDKPAEDSAPEPQSLGLRR